ncbi:hypothetical protein GLOIN_2v1446576 [Rhizophagus irregularis DAOM 181602=DAOM 197198]|nr:hypothetical protein GLOIN_2v1446576 [Rhizophagus irregularis DAOM 181602=DAOM 197198]
MDICEAVSSIRNKNKINIHGYLMVKDKKRNNSYYWYCKKRDQLRCNGRATTMFTKNQYHLVKFTDHNHAADASQVKVVKSLNLLKEQAQQTNDQLVQVIQSVLAVRRANLPAEPQSFANLIILDNLQKTLSNSKFLIRDLNIGNEKVLIFTTFNNVNYLSQSSFWIMDGTFKTVPTIFKQLYTIHGSSIVSKFNQLGDEHNIDLQPQYVLTNFEKALINAVHIELHGVQNKGCHFHLSQSVYHKVQAFGLASQYANDENISLFVKHIPALAFLPCDNIPAAFDELRSNMPPDMPPEVNELLDWFEIYYVHRKVIRRLRNGNVVHSEPLFPPSLWLVTENIEYTFPRTQNSVEAWHRRWETLVGRAHVGLFKIIKELQSEQHQIEIKVESILQENPQPKQKKHNRKHENRIQVVYND